MRCYRSRHFNGHVLLSYLFVVLPLSYGIMVPTGKQTPIQPAEPAPSTPIVAPSARKLPAPVYEYTVENPEPPPLDPSYVPIRFNYIQYLSPRAIVYVPMRMKITPYEPWQDDEKSKFDKHGKIPAKILQKYRDYPTHLQKKYYHHYLTQSNKAQ